MGSVQLPFLGVNNKTNDKIPEWLGCLYETDFILFSSSNDFISQQHCAGGSAVCTRYIRTAGFLCDACICSSLYFILHFSFVTGAVAKREKDGKRLTVQTRKITM